MALFLLLTDTGNHSHAEAELPTEAVQEFVTVLEQIKRNYIYQQSDPALIENAIRGMVSALDPYSRYLNAQELKQFESVSDGTETSQPIWSIEQLSDGIVYINVDFFQLSLAQSITRRLESIADKQGLIIDLRDNGGGFVDSAVEIADLFLIDKLVVRTKGRSAAASRNLSTTGNTPFETLPIVLLVNEGTASAAEIFSAAIQDHKRGVVAGSRTYGKGSVQSLIYTKYGAIQITTSMNYRPSGNAIQGQGVEPDIDLVRWQDDAQASSYSEPMMRLIAQSKRLFSVTHTTHD